MLLLSFSLFFVAVPRLSAKTRVYCRYTPAAAAALAPLSLYGLKVASSCGVYRISARVYVGREKGESCIIDVDGTGDEDDEGELGFEARLPIITRFRLLPAAPQLVPLARSRHRVMGFFARRDKTNKSC